MNDDERDDETSGDRFRDEASYVCGACGEEIVVPLDLSEGTSQRYVEDCPVCCHPNVIHVDVEDDGSARVWSEPE
jgi:DNA-directed RNA polymerase subunit RPC12/RpoP